MLARMVRHERSALPPRRAHRLATIGALALAVLVGCAPTPAGGPRPAGRSSVDRPATTLDIAVRYEPESLASVPLRDTGSGVSSTTRLFNAQLDMQDGKSEPRPYLAEALPQLNTDSWRVFPDGRMETTYHLRQGLTWQDGAPLSADDFAFAWAVYSTPAFGLADSPPLKQMEGVDAPDPRTVIIRWRETYPDAGALAMNFQALPKHLLEEPFGRMDAEAFVAQSFWTTDYVGLGPYRIQRWEPGALLVGTAFEGHVLGRPKIERVIVHFFADENVAFTNLLSGEVEYATGRALRFEHGTTLQKDWGDGARGTVLFTPDTSRFMAAQFRPDLVSPRDLLDPRVRRALVSSIDRDALNEAMFEGHGDMSDIFLTRYSRYERVPDMDATIARAQQTIAHYPYDERKTAGYMSDAGYTRNRDGAFVNAGGERFSMEVWNHASPQYGKELAVIVDTWNKVGFDARPNVLPAAALRDGKLRSSFPALYIASSSRLESFTQAAIPTDANRWSGSNRGSWVNPAYEELWTAFNSTLDPDQRREQIIGMLRLLNDELPAWVLYYNPSVAAFQSVLKGPDNASLNTDVWNIYDWEMR
ncbi:MAG TPA: ABC transporter substrate-binding protein [Chloroflexota bacterium]|nr:ABC transporter substrate-binding protein [Chloroflexota bacterium]